MTFLLRKRYENLISPISELPTELLCKIFLAASQPFDRFSDATNVTLTKVCHSWRTVAVDFAPLWSTLHVFEDSPQEWQRLQEFHRRSRKAPLSILINFDMEPSGLHPLLRTLVENSLPRLLRLEGQTSLIPFLTSSAPILESLAFSCYS